MVSLSLVSHSKKKVAMFAQAGIDGATSGGQASKIRSQKQNLEA